MILEQRNEHFMFLLNEYTSNTAVVVVVTDVTSYWKVSILYTLWSDVSPIQNNIIIYHIHKYNGDKVNKIYYSVS